MAKKKCGICGKGWANGYFKSNGKYFWQCPMPAGWYQLIK